MHALLDLTVADIMSRSVCHIAPDVSLGEAAHLMTDQRISSLLIMVGDHINGILTERDILQQLNDQTDKSTPVGQIMSTPVLTVREDTPFATAHKLALSHHIRHLVVIDQAHKALGLVSETDFRRHVGMNVLSQLVDLEGVMDRELPMLGPQHSVGQALQLMLHERSTYVLVAEHNRPVGILTERDITALLAQSSPDNKVHTQPLREVMHAPVKTIHRGAHISDVTRLMQSEHIRHLVVVGDDDHIMGTITLHRLMERLAPVLEHEQALRLQDQAESEQRVAERHLLMAVEATGLGFWELELPSQRLHLHSETLLRLLGVSSDKVPRSMPEWLNRIHEEDRPAVLKSYQAVLEPGDRLLDCEYRISHHRNEWTWMQIRGGVVERDADGRPRRLVGTSMSIHARKLAEMDILATRNKLQATLDAFPDLLFELSLEGRYLDFHSPRTDLLAVDPAFFLGKTVAEIMPPTIVETTMGALREAHQQGFSNGRQMEISLPSGMRWFELSVAKKENHGTHNPSFICISRDITERKLAERSLRNIIDNAPFGAHLYELQTDGRLIFIDTNHAADTILGVDNQQFIGQTIEEAFPGLIETEVPTVYRRVALTGERFHTEQIVYDEGHIQGAFEVHAFQTAPRRMAAFFSDITERKKTQEALAESRNLLQTIIDTAPLRIFWKDKHLNYLGCNPAFARDADKNSPTEVIGHDDTQLSWHAQAEIYQQDDRAVIQSGQAKLAYEEPQTTPDGRTLWLKTSKVPLRNPNNETIGVLGIYEDITEQKRTEWALQRSEAILRRAQAVAQIGSWYIEAGHNTLEWSEGTYRIFGVPQGQTITYLDFLSQVHPDDRDTVHAAWQTAMAGGIYHIEHRIVVHGEVRWMEERAEISFDADGQWRSALGIVHDITERKRDEERMDFLARFDALTGLPNRTQLKERLRYSLALAKHGNGQLALMFLDLDRFKDINDTLGHSVGDTLLVELARRLRSSLRDEDTVSRLGGDEFIVLLPGTDAQGAERVAKKLLQVVTQAYQIEAYDLNVTASMGVAIYPEDGSDLETLSRNADAAMYRAKQDGRNGYCFFTREMQARSARDLQLINALRHALDRREFSLHYQPQIALSDGRLTGAEALLRWQHPQLGAISPAEFIPVAEDCGLILPIGEWVLRDAVRQAKIWHDGDLKDLVISVNLSAVQFRHPDLPELITRILDQADLPPGCLSLELTERVTMNDPQGAIAVMNKLHDRGVYLAIDDFGTGYSSLSYLKKFKVTKLKIDQSFVRDISTDAEDKAIVSAIIQMSKSLGLQTIAEGVETAEQLAFLREQGCDEVQGYYHSKPLPVDQFETFAKASM
ncbi:EAL domain-containing protein [Leptothrix ochracea]|uniref:EAL domain-containing protein n=1 Tax=Leptothrix ochracea TaxID=735331 RepID=UPI0034E1D40D